MSAAMQSIQSVLAADKDKVLAANRRLAEKIYTNGAILSCAICGRSGEKTAEQMAKYLTKWPKCCGLSAQVKLK